MATKIQNGDTGLSARTALNYLIPTNTPATFNPAAITLTDKETYYAAYSQSGALTITAPTNSYGTGVAFTVKITTDASAINYPVGWKATNDDYATDVADYQLTAVYNGVDWLYSLTKLA